eukprot:m.318565 g.318565  ORF g.318565 m.318565 type:complete len:725 (+) comp19699_c0_seq4:10384-12558(+)
MRVTALVLLVLAAATVAAAGNGSNDTVIAAGPNDENKHVDAAPVILIIASIVIAMTIVFEFLKDLLMESVAETLEPIIEHLFGELTILGFIGLVVFVIVKAKALQPLSERLFGEEEEDALTELIEDVHMVVFLVAIIFLIEVVLLVKLSSISEKHWKILEEDATSSGSLLKAAKHYGHQLAHSSRFSHWWPWSSVSAARCELQYLALREEFVMQRNLHHAAPLSEQDVQVSKQITPQFDFSEYLCILLGETLTSMVEVTPRTWLLLWLTFLTAWATVNYSTLGVACLVVGIIGYGAIFGLTLMCLRLGWIRDMLTPPGPERYASAVARQLRGAGSPAATEESPLLHTTTHNPGQIQQQSDEDLSKEQATLFEDPPRYIAFPKPKQPRGWFQRFVNGVHNDTPISKQEAMFFLSRRGPQFIVTMARFSQMLFALYLGAFSVGLGAKVIRTYSVGVSSAIFIILLIPALIAPFLLRTVMALYVLITFVESQRVPRVVAKVVRVQKTRRAVQVLKLIHTLRGAQLSGSDNAAGHLTVDGSGATPSPTPDSNGGAASKARRQSRRQTRKGEEGARSSVTQVVARTFDLIDSDGSGAVDQAELCQMLERLGVSHSPAEVKGILMELDEDQTGTIDREEFIGWMSEKLRIASQIEMSPEEIVEQLFGVLDRDGSGLVDAEELQETLAALGEDLTYKDVHDIVEDVDTDGDGHINKEEFARFVKDHYEFLV